MKSLKTVTTLAIAVFAVGIYADVAATRYGLEKDTSTIGFYVEAKITNVRGRFLRFHTKTINYTPGKIENLSGQMVIDTSSVFTRDRKRDAHLKEDDFFYVKQYPTATAVLSNVQKTEDDSYIATIQLNIRDKSKTYQVPVQIEEKEKSLRVKGAFPVNRQDFDLTGEHIANLVMNDEVKVRFDVRFKEEIEQKETQMDSAVEDL